MKNYLLTAMNTSAGHMEYKIVEAETIEKATEKMKIWCETTIKNHPLVVFENKKITEITDDMDVIKFTKTNGYTLSNEFISHIKAWESSLQEVLKNEVMIITHFYYGDKLDMANVTLKDGNYMQYNINEKHIGCSGHYCTHEQKAKFVSLEK